METLITILTVIGIVALIAFCVIAIFLGITYWYLRDFDDEAAAEEDISL